MTDTGLGMIGILQPRVNKLRQIRIDSFTVFEGPEMVFPAQASALRSYIPRQ